MKLLRILLPFLYSTREIRTEYEGNNIVQSMARCKRLHKELSILAHPDKHPNKTEIANDIMSQINIYRFNYSKLKELEIRINNELL